ncbi:hypothetical protein BDZ89DRAFT_1115253, partial [Hymenopellis radicata]
MMTAIANLIVRSGCSLKSLRIVDLSDLMGLCEVLALTPELTELKLKYNHWSQSGEYDSALNELWPELTFTNRSQLVPKLTTFIIHIESSSTYDMKRTIDFIGDDLCDCLDSRYRDDNKAARLQNVEILFRFDADIYNAWTRVDIKRLLKLKRDGLNISICTMGGTRPVNRDGSLNLGYTVDLHDRRKVYVIWEVTTPQRGGALPRQRAKILQVSQRRAVS